LGIALNRREKSRQENGNRGIPKGNPWSVQMLSAFLAPNQATSKTLSTRVVDIPVKIVFLLTLRILLHDHTPFSQKTLP
jgi:hypothetical protein